MAARPIQLSARVRALEPELVALRRRLHAIPELAGQEHETQRLVLDYLAGCGLSPEPLAGTGVRCEIAGRAPGPVLLLRADMDGLAIEERTGLGFSSRHPGRMHACGHDAHLAMALGAARLLAAEPPARGAVRLVCQPAEESGRGAAALIAAGVLSEPPVDSALAFHVWSPYPLGRVVCLDGPALAAVDAFALTVRGRGAHAARPDEGLDPIPVAAGIVSAAQGLVARRKPPGRPAVLSFTAVAGGSGYNVIPEAVRLQGTLRFFDRTLGEQLRAELEQLARGLAAAAGAEVEIESAERLPPLVNQPAVAERVRRVAAGLGGPAAEPPAAEPLLVGEDFGLILERVPGAMVLLGCAPEPPAEVFGHHHPRFDLDERVLGLGVELWLGLVAELTSA